MRFLDSYRLMASSLDTLSSNLKKDQLHHLKFFNKNDLLSKKGVPYFPAYKARLFAVETALSCALQVIRRCALYTKFVWQKLKNL
jgi:hypothetical protein